MCKIRREGLAMGEIVKLEERGSKRPKQNKSCSSEIPKKEKAGVKKIKLFGPLHIHFSCPDVNTLILRPELGLPSLKSETSGTRSPVQLN